jgi:predicted nucleotidyltransferase
LKQNSGVSEIDSPAPEQSLADRLIEAVAAWARRRDDVLGLALVGSHARGEARIDSDIDLALLVADPDAMASSQASRVGKTKNTVAPGRAAFGCIPRARSNSPLHGRHGRR